MATGVPSTAKIDIPELEISITETVLGEGAFATVYKATWIRTAVAVKCIRERYGLQASGRCESNSTAEAFGLLRAEAKLSWDLCHPRIVRLFGVYAKETRHIGLVMELMETSLWSRVRQEPALTAPCIVHVLHDMTSALTYLHSRNILHRDISPRNTLLSRGDDGERRLVAKLADFATAKTVETIGFCDHSSNYSATFPYLPYEAIEKDPFKNAFVFSSAVDVYSVGAVGLFSILREQPGTTPRYKAEYLERIGSRHALYGLLKGCLQDNPCKRPSSVQLLAELGRIHVPKPCTCSGLVGRRQETANSGNAVARITERELARADIADSVISMWQQAVQPLKWYKGTQS